MSTRPNNGKIEDEVTDVLADARTRIMDLGPDEGLSYRLDEIEATLRALAVYLDKAFGEIRGETTIVRGTSPGGPPR
jgi:hypothetical protein